MSREIYKEILCLSDVMNCKMNEMNFTCDDLTQPNMAHLRKKIAQFCQDFLLLNINTKFIKVVDILWKCYAYQMITKYRKDKLKSPKLKYNFFKYQNFLSECVCFYLKLLHRLKSRYILENTIQFSAKIEQDYIFIWDDSALNKLPLEDFTILNEAICNIYCHIGHLYRYMTNEIKKGPSIEMNKSILMYNFAIFAYPMKGITFNYLSIVAQSTNNYLDALYYYMRCMDSYQPYDGLKTNMLMYHKCMRCDIANCASSIWKIDEVNKIILLFTRNIIKIFDVDKIKSNFHNVNDISSPYINDQKFKQLLCEITTNSIIKISTCTLIMLDNCKSIDYIFNESMRFMYWLFILLVDKANDVFKSLYIEDVIYNLQQDISTLHYLQCFEYCPKIKNAILHIDNTSIDDESSDVSSKSSSMTSYEYLSDGEKDVQYEYLVNFPKYNINNKVLLFMNPVKSAIVSDFEYNEEIVNICMDEIEKKSKPYDEKIYLRNSKLKDEKKLTVDVLSLKKKIVAGINNLIEIFSSASIFEINLFVTYLSKADTKILDFIGKKQYEKSCLLFNFINKIPCNEILKKIVKTFLKFKTESNENIINLNCDFDELNDINLNLYATGMKIFNTDSNAVTFSNTKFENESFFDSNFSMNCKRLINCKKFVDKMYENYYKDKYEKNEYKFYTRYEMKPRTMPVKGVGLTEKTMENLAALRLKDDIKNLKMKTDYQYLNKPLLVYIHSSCFFEGMVKLKKIYDVIEECILIIPSCAIQQIDHDKKTDVNCREANRWLESKLERGLAILTQPDMINVAHLNKNFEFILDCISWCKENNDLIEMYNGIQFLSSFTMTMTQSLREKTKKSSINFFSVFSHMSYLTDRIYKARNKFEKQKYKKDTEYFYRRCLGLYENAALDYENYQEMSKDKNIDENKIKGRSFIIIVLVELFSFIIMNFIIGAPVIFYTYTGGIMFSYVESENAIKVCYETKQTFIDLQLSTINNIFDIYDAFGKDDLHNDSLNINSLINNENYIMTATELANFNVTLAQNSTNTNTNEIDNPTSAMREILERFIIKVNEINYRSGLCEEISIKEWGVKSGFLYALSIMSTIGYGHVTPKTIYGQIATILYGIIGIPIFLIWIAILGSYAARFTKFALYSITKSLFSLIYYTSKQEDNDHQENVMTMAELEDEQYCQDDVMGSTKLASFPISLVLIILALNFVVGMFIFVKIEGRSYSTMLYFCFITLSTIGFGDIVPGFRNDSEVYLYITIAYIIIGIALVSMCLSLIQDQLYSSFATLMTKFNKLQVKVRKMFDRGSKTRQEIERIL
ncbi:hypothetical protein A3Q56_00549 [Intoshia linei]|uniref:Potassium channel domain-containing protein n=1 Tax=Intoshia linei TaxID=1819745 RepID=A0A177BDM4_9BILA|nr:hypothetical protein A3Q56_00549 [Intoshia linei]